MEWGHGSLLGFRVAVGGAVVVSCCGGALRLRGLDQVPVKSVLILSK